MIASRRSLFGFGAALIAAPAIVRVASIMPVSVRKPLFLIEWNYGPNGISRLRTVGARIENGMFVADASVGERVYA